MPVSRPRKKKSSSKSNSGNLPGSQPVVRRRAVTSLDDLHYDTITVISKLDAADLDSIGLSMFYTLSAPSRDLNQCVAATATLMFARRLFNEPSEIIPVVLDVPWSSTRWGVPHPILKADGTTNGHVILLTPGGKLIDVTVAQFRDVQRRRGGLPIFTRSPQLWEVAGDPATLKRTVTNSGALAQVMIKLGGNDHLTYHLHHPYGAAEIVGGAFLRANYTNDYASFLRTMVNNYVWLVANVILTRERAHEVDHIRSRGFAQLVRQAAGAPRPE